MNEGVPTEVEAALRPGHVLRAEDITGAAIDDLVDEISPRLPVFLDHRGPDERTARSVTTEVLDALEQILLDLFPTWLDGEPGQLLDVDEAVHAARTLCHRAGLVTGVVIDLARAAASRSTPRRTQAPELRAAGLMGLVRHAYRRAAVVLAVRSSAEISTASQRAAAAAYEWLAEHGHITVWLTSDALPSIDRIPTVRLGLGITDQAAEDPGKRAAASDQPILLVSRPVGAPCPNSRAERALEAALSRHDWARDRIWNRRPADLDPLAPAVVVDLLWTAQRVVVEVDGADHRRADKYASDRARDNMLQRHAYMILRYTNEQVLTDADLVADELRDILAARSASASAHRPTQLEENTWTTRS